MIGQWLHENLYGIITTLLSGGGVIAYFLERNKRKIQEKKEISSAKQEEANALETIQTVYDRFVKDSMDRYADFKVQIDSIKKELQNVYTELEKVTEELNEEKKRSSLLNIAYEALKKTCESYTNK